VPRAARFENGKRPSFQKDRSVASSPIPGDYRNTMYDRGHMVPNRAIVTRFGPDVQKKTFQMTNIAPQRPALNRGPWREMELRIADLWTAMYGEIWVIVGALSGTSPSARETIAAGGIDVPEQYYMISVAQAEDGVRALAVLVPQTSGRWAFPAHDIVTIDELEKLSGLEFFPEMPSFLKRPLQADRPTRLWPIRFRDILKLILLRFA
jgi:endonuclease G